MTDTHPRPGFQRRSPTALLLLLVPLLMTACASHGGSPGTSSAGGAPSTTSAASAGTPVAGAGADLFKEYPTSKQFCALVAVTDVSAAMEVKPAYPAVKLSGSPVECTYNDGSMSSIVSVEWSPKGGGQLDDYLEVSAKKKPVAIDVGGHAGRSLSGDVQVVVGDAAIDVFGLGTPNASREAALAAAFLQKVG